ncbi:MAG TPA: endolytic transglycosylase MltG [Mariprofundaceae bacterium]|nr:endolytic transglycosylase MltG [Mariprofundaceae bacterium]
MHKRNLVIVAIVVALLPVLFFVQQINSAHNVAPVDVVIVSGDASSTIARKLEEAGAIHSQWPFKLLVRLSGKAAALKLGLYHFEGEMSASDVLAKIESGSVMRFQVTVPEGLRTHDILSLLAEKTQTELSQWRLAIEALLPDEEWEGRLLPETYNYAKPVNPKEVLSQMLEAQRRVIASITTHALEADRLRIIASIIEKETGVDAERPLVSAAIHNRIKIGMPLQMDPTVIYGIWRRDGSFSGNIRKKDLAADTPWNSYRHKGLPPTPICNPGEASLRAAANPADVTYLYFVADGTGGHAFATTHKEHQANVQRWIEIERERNRQVR